MSMLEDALGGRAVSGGTFFGLPACSSLDELDAAVCILGVPIATSYAGFGAFSAPAPAAIRSAFHYYAPIIDHYDFEIGGSLEDEVFGPIVDAGDLSTSETDYPANRALIQQAVEKILAADAAPLVIGGDDSIPIPVWQAFEGRGPFTVLQFDAHLDYRDEVQGERHGLSSNMRRASEMPWVERIVQVGMRSMGSARRAEVEAAAEWGTEVITAHEVHRGGVEPVLDRIPAGSQVLVNLDIDSMDSSAMPAVMSPTPGGLSYWDLVETLHGVAEKATLAGFNLTEFMPERDPDGTCALTAARIVFNAAALMARTK